MCLLATLMAAGSSALEPFCPEGVAPDPRVLFCDDFDDGIPLREKYLRYDDGEGRFVMAPGEGRQGTRALAARWDTGVVDAGRLVLTVGRSPADPERFRDRDLQELHWRFFLRMGPDWGTHSGRLSQATGLVSERWAQSFSAQLVRAQGSRGLALDAETGIGPGGGLRTRVFQDRAGLQSIGSAVGKAAVFAAEVQNRWVCIEAHLRLNAPGESDGSFSMWVDSKLDASRQHLNLRDAYVDYGVNTVFVENVWEGGAPGPRARYLDDLVVARHRIGCGSALAPPGRTLAPPGRPVVVQGGLTPETPSEPPRDARAPDTGPR